ncbi:MAG: glutamyl-tRNA reductase [Bacteroidota bacterium]|nr:glutamyl-tRNA reductase [Bacteroidota bacterium]
MHNHFKAVGLSFSNAPIEIREQIAMDENVCRRLLRYFKEFTDITDVFILSTCNRTEIYYSSEEDQSDTILKLIGIEKNLQDITTLKGYFNIYNEHDKAVQHLFDVSMGLEAQVVGDMQISNQVKRAYQMSADENLAGPFLHRLLHTIFFTNKRVVQETSFRDGAASVSYATAELISELTVDIKNPKVLIIGLGEIGADLCRNLSGSSNNNIFITNRTMAKAEAIANECGLQVLPFENVYEEINDADVVVCAVGSQTPFITRDLLKDVALFKYKYFLDLSVPRSIDLSIEELPGVLVYNIDNIQNKTSEALQRRIASIPKVKEIIKDAIEEFNNWSEEMAVSPTIQKLKNALEQIRQQELARYVKSLNEEESQLVDKVTKGMMQKIMKLPVLQLKAACKRGEAETLIDVLNDLFNLEKEPQKLK